MPGAFGFYAIILVVVSVAHARDILITVDNPNIYWDSDNFAPLSSTICSVDLSFNEQCTDNWWFTNETSPEVATWGKFVSMSFDFVGASIDMGIETFPGGGAFFADVDGNDFRYSTDAEAASTALITIGENLNPSQTHSVTITYDSDLFSDDTDARTFIAILGFVVRGAPESGTTGSTIDFVDDNSVDPTEESVPNNTDSAHGPASTGGGSGFGGNGGVAASAADQPTIQAPETSSKPLSPGAIGGLIGVILLAILLAVVTAVIYTRRQRRLRLNAGPRAYVFGPESQNMQEANNRSDTGIHSRMDDGKSILTAPKRPETRISALYESTVPARSASP